MANKAFESADVDPKSISLADLVAALKASSGNDDESMRKRAQFEAEAYERLEEKENTKHPGISVFSHPEGDVLHPKDKLKCKMQWVGEELWPETLTPQEIALLNSSEPGIFTFHKTDGAIESVTIVAERGPAGNITALQFGFPCRGDNKHNHPGMVAMLREVQGMRSREDELLAEIAALRARRIETTV